MGRTKGAKNLPSLKKSTLIALSELNGLSNRQVVIIHRCDEKTVRNARKRASEINKENIDSLFLETYQRRSQFNRSLAINKRLQR